MTLFDDLGFRWDRSEVPTSIPVHSMDRVCFRLHKMLPEFVWDASVLEGNPFTFPEVKTLLDGVTVGGRKISDQEQILNLAETSKRLLAMVRSNEFSLSKSVFTELNGMVVRKEALEWGVFRGEGHEQHYTPDVGLGEHGRYTPLPTLPSAPELNRVFREGVAALHECKPFERAAAFFLFGALQQFFFDGNKRTSRFMMNGILMSHG
ncbi:MAG: cell filamentation protein Fic, partial [Ferrovum sp.]|nr:cell filamentation protein Fic [Ferrovum sp.]